MTAVAKPPAISEAEFMGQVTDLAELFGWSWVHFRPAQTSRGWRTPVSGPLGKGWPDLVLVKLGRHGNRGRVIYAELKRDGAVPNADQVAVLAFLAEAGCEQYVWHPAELDAVMAVLR